MKTSTADSWKPAVGDLQLIITLSQHRATLFANINDYLYPEFLSPGYLANLPIF
jgi:hypothetical protein